MELHKIYRAVSDQDATREGDLRIVDESGEDYGYAAGRFFVLQVPEALAKALSVRSGIRGRRAKRALQPTVVSRRRLNA